MIPPNTLTYARWLDLYAAPATSRTIRSGDPTTGRSGDDVTDHSYHLDLSSGSYAVDAHGFGTRLTAARWHDMIRTGARDTGSAAAAERIEARENRELIGAW